MEIIGGKSPKRFRIKFAALTPALVLRGELGGRCAAWDDDRHPQSCREAATPEIRKM